ncbi:MAG: hypothetical protein M1823_007925, partial [Watsoniomyces obsoletus]
MRPPAAPPPSQSHLAFISASQAQAKRVARRWTGGLLALTVGAFALSGVTWQQKQVADEQKAVAVASKKEAESEKDRALASLERESRNLVARSAELVRLGDTGAAIQSALEALPRAEGERTVVPGAYVALHNAVDQVRSVVTLVGHEDTVLWATFSPDRKRIATSSLDKTSRLWDARTGAQITVLGKHDDIVNCAIFSPDG